MGKGSLKFVLRGQKLKGAFALSKMHGGRDPSGGKDENAWLLVKKQGDFATPQHVRLSDRSVLTGRNLEEIAATREAEWRSNRDTDEGELQPDDTPAPTVAAATLPPIG